MTLHPAGAGHPPASRHLRDATGDIHQRLETRFDAIAELSDPALRMDVLRRYAALHIPADAALRPLLDGMEGLDMAARSRADLLAPFAGTDPLPAFPQPASKAEALGLLYVLEGSTLGGRLILRELAARGVTGEELAFLDPYGAETGRMWRSFITVLDRETADDATSLDEAARGALDGFRHAEAILCGSAP